MIFLIPKQYNYIEIIKDKGFEEESKIIKSDINGKIIYWENVIKLIEDNEFALLNTVFRDLAGLLKDWYEIEQIDFEPGEVEYLFATHYIENQNDNFSIEEVQAMTQTNLIAKSFVKLINLIDKIEQSIVVPKKKTKITDISDEYGLYFKDKSGNDILFFGIWFPFWQKYRKPICFGVDKDYDLEIVKRFKKRYPSCVPMEDWLMYWIEKDKFSKNIVEETKSEIEELLNYLLADIII